MIKNCNQLSLIDSITNQIVFLHLDRSYHNSLTLLRNDVEDIDNLYQGWKN